MPPENQPTGDPQNPEPGVRPVTPPKQDPPATDDSEETITLKKSDYKNLISQRDRNAEAAKNSEALNEAIQQQYMEDVVKKGISAFLEANSDKFPDLSAEDLMHVDDPDFLEAEATRLQDKISLKVQERLKGVRKEMPKLTEAQRAEKLDELRKQKSPRGKFSAFLKLQRQ